MNRTLHVSDSSSVCHQEFSTVHTAIGVCHTGYADCLLAGSWSILIPLASSQHKFKICKSVHHRTIQINQQPDATVSQVYYPDVYLQLNMFRASLRPSSGA